MDVVRFEPARILVVGDVMLDRYWGGETARISPEAPVMVVDIQNQSQRAGGAANVALNIATLGGQASLMGFIGSDEPGKALTELLAHRVNSLLSVIPGYSTIVKLRIHSHRQQMMRLDFDRGIHDYPKQDFLENYKAALSNVDAVVFSDYGKGALSHIEIMIDLARKSQKPILIDPKGTQFVRYRGATVLKPNLKEFEAVVGHCGSEEILIDRAHQLLKELDLETLMLTRGSAGMSVFSRAGHHFNIEAHSGELVDVTGAGDTVAAAYMMSMVSGYSPQKSAEIANLAAGVAVSKLGTVTISLNQINALRAQRMSVERGVVSPERLLQYVRHLQMAGKKVVFTNGCFDVLHAGHVAYLEKASQLGDALIVAINSDESISRLKGPKRPIAPLESRANVLAALRCVDWVVAFEEDTPEALLKLLKPDVLAKGGDYTPEKIVGADIVYSYGGKVISVPHDYLHITTTSLVQKMK